ncbi:MAG: tRNA pseudouridine(13) synthase TruD, partial [Thermoplasmata archaeon]|nr:tRNA pseudouridine(13) synthase TruD [Thermoplasmata archaeon]
MTALHEPSVPTGEEVVGLLGFLTGTSGLGGRLRTEVEDFIVVEDSLPPPEVPGGKFTAVTIRLHNWETNRFVRQMSRKLGISSRRVRFAGVKDKRAVTTQLFTIEAPEDSVSGLRMADVEVLSLQPTDRHIGLGDLVANAFEISVTDLDVDDGVARQRVKDILTEAEDAGGFPNFYGPQRFGVSRPVSHLVGRDLVLGDVRMACMTYLTHVGPGESEEAREARLRFKEDGDARQALRAFPKNLGNERNMLEHLLHNPEDHKGAIRRLPFNLQLMFVHAYQGQAFNLVVSERMRRGLPMDRPLEGDLLVPVDERGNPRHDQGVPVTSRNLAKAERQVVRGRALVSGLVPGTDAPMAGGEMGEIEASVMEKMGISPGDFRIVDLTELTASGIRREVAITGVMPRWT